MPEAKTAPEALSQTPHFFRRLFHGLRVFRKRTVYVSIVAALLVGADAWIVVTINGWEADSEDLQTKATELGESIGAVNANTEEAEIEIALFDEQQVAAALRADILADEAATEQALSDAIRDAALDLEKCVTNRLKVVTGLWNHGRSFVAALDAEANRECAAAQATLDRLVKELT